MLATGLSKGLWKWSLAIGLALVLGSSLAHAGVRGNRYLVFTDPSNEGCYEFNWDGTFWGPQALGTFTETDFLFFGTFRMEGSTNYLSAPGIHIGGLQIAGFGESPTGPFFYYGIWWICDNEEAEQGGQAATGIDFEWPVPTFSPMRSWNRGHAPTGPFVDQEPLIAHR